MMGHVRASFLVVSWYGEEACHESAVNSAVITGRWEELPRLSKLQLRLWMVPFHSERSVGTAEVRCGMSEQMSKKGTACTTQSFQVRESLNFPGVLLVRLALVGSKGVCLCQSLLL